MRNIPVLLLLAATLLSSCEKKKENAPAVETITALEGSKAVRVELSDYDRYEGRIVESATGQWFLIKEGARWRTNSVESSDDYLKKLPVGPEYVVKNVPAEVLQQFPEVGELLPNVEFKKDEKISVNK